MQEASSAVLAAPMSALSVSVRVLIENHSLVVGLPGQPVQQTAMCCFPKYKHARGKLRVTMTMSCKDQRPASNLIRYLCEVSIQSFIGTIISNQMSHD